jgi:hypothetical protein
MQTEQGIFLPAQGIIRAGREWQGISRKTGPLAPTPSDSAKMLHNHGEENKQQ